MTIFTYNTEVADGFEAIYDLGHAAATAAFRAAIRTGVPALYERMSGQADLDALALRAAAQYREEQQARVPNFTDSDQRFDAAWAAGYIVAFVSERDCYQEDPNAYCEEYGQVFIEANR